MKYHLNKLYRQILSDIATCTRQTTNLKKWIEHCFSIPVSTWMEESKMWENYIFRNKKEEIWFFKKMKPRMTAVIEYYSLLYKAEMFVPDKREDKLAYWEYEVTDTKNFFERNAEFYQYYKSGASDMDEMYFMKKDGNSPRDQLVASFIAKEKYLRYVQKKEHGKRVKVKYDSI